MRIKNLLFWILLSTFLMADMSKGEMQITLNKLTEKQAEIINHLKEIDVFLQKYDKLKANYLNKMRSFLSDKSKCSVISEKLFFYKNKYGLNHDFTKQYIIIDKDCYSMREKRLKALSTLKEKIELQRLKVDDIIELKKTEMEELDRVHKYGSILMKMLSSE